MLTMRGDTPVRTTLPEELIELYHSANLSSCDIIPPNPYQWAVSGKTGVKAYAKTIFAKVQQDELEKRYAIRRGDRLQRASAQIEAGPNDDMLELEAHYDDEDEA